MADVAGLLNAAGPFAGWVAFALVVLGLLWLYASDRLVSIGRHTEQADHYEQRLEKTELEAEQYRNDRDYWRDISLDLMAAVAAKAGDQ